MSTEDDIPFNKNFPLQHGTVDEVVHSETVRTIYSGGAHG